MPNLTDEVQSNNKQCKELRDALEVESLRVERAEADKAHRLGTASVTLHRSINNLLLENLQLCRCLALMNLSPKIRITPDSFNTRDKRSLRDATAVPPTLELLATFCDAAPLPCVYCFSLIYGTERGIDVYAFPDHE
jgi:hypothetical protein